ncbi:MAG: hypothetical protein EGP67_00975 [Bacteroidales bacterium]|nr:hypothetical protein [Bacteroidales bacterium]HAM94709.1 hypothetical protein [Porphyromonadaceae bacterium]
MSDKAKLLIARNYVDAICRDDISRVDDVQRLRTGGRPCASSRRWTLNVNLAVVKNASSG